MKKRTKIEPSARAPQDMKDLERALSMCDDPDERETFTTWKNQLTAGVMADLGTKRRAYTRDFIIATEDARKAAGVKSEPPKLTEKALTSRSGKSHSQRSEWVRRLETEVMCGPLPLAPPGCVGNAPRFGRMR